MSATTRLDTAVASGAMLFCAPGRVNIIGEHTDYNEGLVLPTNADLYTWISVKPRSDRIVHVNSLNLDEATSFELDTIEPSGNSDWIEYVKGVAAEIQLEGVQLRGADLVIDGEIPIGGGLSSSASLELAVATSLLAVADSWMPRPIMAQLCQRAERRFAGVNCGIMDQYSIACCKRGNAILIDCRTLDTDSVTIPDEMTLLITDSGVKHTLPDSGYNKRADECRQALRTLVNANRGISSLRDVSMDLLARNKDLLGDPLFRRCRHVILENQRVRDAIRALRSGNVEQLGSLVTASHSSLRDDFEVSCDEVDSLVTIANGCSGVLGSRMVGGGFGGCVLTVARAEKADDVAQQIRREYGKVIGAEPWIHALSPADPVREVKSA